MSITREQVADLREGDVVEIAYDEYPEALTRGPLRRATDGRLWVADIAVVEKNGEPVWNGHLRLLTVVSRAPRPLYVNSNRTEPAPKDVVRDGEGVVRYVARTSTGGLAYWSHDYEPGWGWTHHSNPPKPLTLLVDGTTGQVVP